MDNSIINHIENLYVLIPIFLILIPIIRFIYQYIQYKSGSYYKVTHNKFLETINNQGRIGEFKIYKNLKYLEKDGSKFLFNLYIPTEDKNTTEIDVLMINKYGIFVFESKNYSGWIFGNESQWKWTQSLYVGHGDTQKEHFYNPILQNEYHIKNLQKIINIPNIHSIVVFSNDCEIKKLTRTKNQTFVIYQAECKRIIEEISTSTLNNLLSQMEIDYIFAELYQYSQTTTNEKEKHILNLKSS